MRPTDRSGYPVDMYPESYLSGIFLGLNGEGIGEYLREDNVFLAECTDNGLQVPPKEYGIAHDFYLENMTLSEYLIETKNEIGPWIFLTDVAKQSLENDGHDPEAFLID